MVEGGRCELPESDPIHAPVPTTDGGPQREWAGDSPFFLIFERGPKDNVGIDVDAPGWIEGNKALFRSPGVWLLIDKKSGRPLFSIVLHEGDQFYWTRHHVGNLMAGREIVLIGMGKKMSDGTPVNLWLMPNGMVVGGPEADADLLASRMLG